MRLPHGRRRARARPPGRRAGPGRAVDASASATARVRATAAVGLWAGTVAFCWDGGGVALAISLPTHGHTLPHPATHMSREARLTVYLTRRYASGRQGCGQPPFVAAAPRLSGAGAGSLAFTRLGGGTRGQLTLARVHARDTCVSPSRCRTSTIVTRLRRWAPTDMRDAHRSMLRQRYLFGNCLMIPSESMSARSSDCARIVSNVSTSAL